MTGTGQEKASSGDIRFWRMVDRDHAIVALKGEGIRHIDDILRLIEGTSGQHVYGLIATGSVAVLLTQKYPYTVNVPTIRQVFGSPSGVEVQRINEYIQVSFGTIMPFGGGSGSKRRKITDN